MAEKQRLTDSVFQSIRSFSGNTRGMNVIGKLIIAGWMIFSIPFVIYQGWVYLEIQYYQRGVRDGAQQASDAAYGDLITKASNPGCKPVFVQQGQRKIQVINLQCLKTTTTEPIAKPEK